MPETYSEITDFNRLLDEELNLPLEKAFRDGGRAFIHMSERASMRITNLHPWEFTEFDGSINRGPMIVGAVAIRGAFVLPGSRPGVMRPYFAFSAPHDDHAPIYGTRLGESDKEAKVGFEKLVELSVLARRAIGEL